MSCRHCGAPIALAKDIATVCEFCGTENAPLPKEVPVPVPVQVVHKVVQVVGGLPTAADEGELRCPHCRKRLVAVRASEVDLHGCAGCGGIWIDNASARRVLASPDRVFGELALRAGENARGKAPRAASPTCAACPAVLDRVSAHGIELDVCGEHGTWFDAYELHRLTAALRGEAVPGVRARADSLIRCAGCNTSIRVDKANLGDQGPMCDTCWRERQAQLVAAGEKQIYDGSSTAGAAGVLIGVAAVLIGASTSRR